MRLRAEERERYARFEIPAGWHLGRVPGISAFVRLKNEAEYILPALDSIAGWCDEILIALQGEQSDGTDLIVNEWAQRHPRQNARVVRYPFDSVSNGPGHGEQLIGSVHERAYFYNWCLAQTRHTHALKWDGDMVALDDTGPALRKLCSLHDVVKFGGVDIVGNWNVGHRERCAAEPRLFKVTDRTFYITSAMCEKLDYPNWPEWSVVSPMFLHFKWAKQEYSITTAWPDDWQSMPHFQEIAKRAEPVAPYSGPVPEVMR